MKYYYKQLYNFILTDIKDVFKYLPYGLLGFLCLMLLFFFIGHIADNKHVKQKMIPYSIFGSYCIITLIITFLSRESGTREGLDFELFSTMKYGPRADAYVVENVLLFIPFGILLPICFEKLRRMWMVGMIGLSISFIIELSQYATKRGYAQVDDLMTNTFGTLIGYMVFFLCFYILRRTKYYK